MSGGIMGRRRWSLAVFAACGLLGLTALWPAGALAEEVFSSGSLSLSESSLVIAGSPEEGVQLTAEREAELANPSTVQTRTESETAYETENLGATGSEELASRLFPGLIDEPDGGPPRLPEGGRIASFFSDDAASLELPEGKHGVVSALMPIAVEDPSSGARVPIDLVPRASGGGFEAARPASRSRVRVGGRLSEGASLSNLGVTLTAVSEAGVPLESVGGIDGASVFYGDSENAQEGVVDVDSLVKLDTFGFSEETVLRSERSPQKLFFRVGLPAGASLVQSPDGSGTVRIVDEGSTMAFVPAASGRDVSGTAVPVVMSVSGDMLTLTVERQAGEYRYPIVVDPTVVEAGEGKGDVLLAEPEGPYKEGTWGFYNAENPSNFKGYRYELSSLEKGAEGPRWGVEDRIGESVVAGQRAFFYYPTQGESKIYAFTAETTFEESFNALKKFENVLGIENVHSATNEAKQSWIEKYPWTKTTLCTLAGCATGTVTSSNDKSEAFFMQDARESGPLTAGTSRMRDISVDIVQEASPVEAFDRTDPVLEPGGWPNALYVGWVSTTLTSPLVGVNAKDPGLGVNEITWSSPQSSTWKPNSFSSSNHGCLGVQCEECYEASCGGKPLTAWISGLPEGEDTVEAIVKDPAGLSATGSATVKVDSARPHSVTLSGLGPGGQVGQGEYKLSANATDGSGTTPSSGVRSLALLVDGREVGKRSGSCSPGPCTARGEWTLVGRNYATGRHTVTVIATDYAGNEGSEAFFMFVHPGSVGALGPGVVNRESGEFTLSATDVSMGGGLTVSRSYASEHPTAGVGGPLGAQWGIGLGGQESLVKQSDGSMVLTDANGARTIFAPTKEGGYLSPAGDSNLALSSTPCEEKQTEFMLKNAATATTTCFALPSGGSGEVWAPHITKGAAATDVVTYSYEAKEVPAGSKNMVTRPHEALAPVPAGVGPCSPEIKPGCRTLKFNYAEVTTAKGEAQSEWGDVEGQLTRVYYSAWDPVGKAKKEVEVAHYLYDKQGRLRTVWDPRVTPEPLKTYYGYDSEGHVTVLTPPGQESWAFTYGPIAGDASTGRLLKVLRAPASAKVWKGETLSNSEAPRLSGSAVSGAIMSVSTGKWSPEPVAYAYQWEQCNSEGKACVRLAGATNASYKLAESDVGHRLVASVTAINGGGSVVRETLAGETVAKASISEYALPSGSAPGGVCRGPDGNLWFTDRGTSKIGKITTAGVITEYNLPASTLSTSITAGSDGNLWFNEEHYNTITKAYEDRIGKITTSGTITEYGLPANSNPRNIVSGPDGNLWFTEEGTSKIAKITVAGAITEYALASGTDPVGITSGPDGNLWYTQAKAAKIAKITTSGSVTEYALPAEDLGATSIAAGPDGNLWYTTLVLSGPRIGKITTSGSVSEYAVGSAGSNIAAGPDGDLWYSVGSAKIAKITTSGEATEYSLPSGSEMKSAAAGPDGNVWFTEYGTSKIGKFVMPAKSREEYALPAGSKPQSVVEGPDGNVWFTEEATSKIAKRNPTTKTITEYALPAESDPYGIAKGPDGNLWFTDDHTNKIGKITTAGAITEYALPSGSTPKGIVAGPDGNLWFTEYGTSKIAKITTAGSVSEYALPAGSEPQSIASGPDGKLWFTDYATNRIGKITTSGSIVEYTLPKEKSNPYAIIAGPDGNLWFTEFSVSRIGKITTSGSVTEYVLPVFSFPEGIAAGADENVWFTEDGTSSLGKITTVGGIVSEYALPKESEPHGIAGGPEDDLWYADYKTNEIGKITTSAEPSQPPQPGSTIEYGVRISGFGAPHAMGSKEVEGWGQKDHPSGATAIFPADEPQPWPAKSYTKATVYYQDAEGHTVNVASPTGAIATSEYNETNDVIRSLNADNRAAALKEGAKSAEVAKLLDTQSKYNSEGTELTETLGPRHLVKLTNGKEVQARNHTVYTYDEGVPAEGGPYRLVTKTTQGAQTETEGEQDTRTTTTAYSGQSNLGWKLRKPTSVTTDPTGLKLTRTILYEEATGNVTETRAPGSTGAEDTHNSRTIYYTAAANTKYPACGEHPEWAQMPCQTQPGAQPNTAGLPNLPVTTLTYNVYGQPAKTTSTVTECVKVSPGTGKYTNSTCTTAGSGEYEIKTNTRTTTITYDEAGRPSTVETTSTTGKALPKVTEKYNTTTGMLVEQSTASESLKSTFNTVGQLENYTDADANTTKYEYENGGDARLVHVDDGKGTQTYTYDTTTGLVTQLVDSAAGTFTASYDAEGNLTSEGFPDAMSANITLNQAGQATGVQYVKNAYCAKTCPETWYSDTVVPSIHGQWMTQQNNQKAQTYTYDQAGRLSEALDNVTGKGCYTRIYNYGNESNRLTLTTRPPGLGGACASEGGTVEKHAYDLANRLLDTGVAYEPFGNTTKLPAADAGGYELTSTFFQNNQLSTQEQNKQTIGYQLDPGGRQREIVSTGTITATEIQHYPSPGASTPTWTGELSANYTRYITGISGTLAAIQHNSEKPVLQLSNLHGDIIATTTDSETATTLASTISEASEYGVPATEAPPKYSWLGAHQIPTTLPSGIQSMGVRSYIPQLGRYLQTDPVPGGSANAYAYTYGDPVNSLDLNGDYTVGGPSEALINNTAEMSSNAATEQAAMNEAAKAEAERKAAEAAGLAGIYAGMEAEGPEEEWWEEEEWEEEWGEEYAAWHHGAGAEHHESKTEEGLLYQPLASEGEESRSASTRSLPLCKAGVEGPCTHLVDGAENAYCTNNKVPEWAKRSKCRHNPAWQKVHSHHHSKKGITKKDVVCTGVSTVTGGIGAAVGAVAGDGVGGIAGGAVGGAAGSLVCAAVY